MWEEDGEDFQQRRMEQEAEELYTRRASGSILHADISH